jgi:diguanylate cyclase (GGDEF)-like protein
MLFAASLFNECDRHLAGCVDVSGRFFHVYGARSVSYFIRMRESNRQLRHIASHDPLTDLLNAGAYYATCDQLIHLANRHQQQFSVLFVDLDHFKKINDTYGHEAGDIVLKAVAKKLQESVRQSDAVGRIGGEEFSVFLPETDLSGAVKLAEYMRSEIENLMPQIGHQRIKVTASIGVASDEAAKPTSPPFSAAPIRRCTTPNSKAATGYPVLRKPPESV